MEDLDQTTSTRRIKSFGVLRTSATMGLAVLLFILALYLLIGAIVLIAYLNPHSVFHEHPGPRPNQMIQGATWWIGAMPFLEGTMAFVFCAGICWTYNRIARFTGGLEVHVVRLPERVIETSPTANS
jgi:hypothetical protein